MNKTWFCLILVLLSVTGTFSQNISKTWTLDKEQDNQETFAQGHNLHLDEGIFNISTAKDTLATGDYILQNKLLVLFYSPPQDSIVNYRISALTDSSMTLKEADKEFHFKTEDFNNLEEAVPAKLAKEMVPSAGISFNSIWRGALGMLSLLFIAFLFSSNRRAIKDRKSVV